MKETNVGQSLRGTFTAWTCIMYCIEDSRYIDTYSVATDIIGDDHGEVSSKMEKIQRMATIRLRLRFGFGWYDQMAMASFISPSYSV